MKKTDAKLPDFKNNLLMFIIPQVDISETEDFYFIRVNLPGIKKDDFSIKMDAQTLIIEGEKKKPKYGEYEIFHRIEREFGVFRRAITFREKIDTDDVYAELKDGVLFVKIKKAHLNINIEIK